MTKIGKRNWQLAAWIIGGIVCCGCNMQSPNSKTETEKEVVALNPAEHTAGVTEEKSKESEQPTTEGESDSPFQESAGKTEETKEGIVSSSEDSPKYNPLTEFEKYVILNKGTERAFVGEYTDNKQEGTYVCRRCNAPLYESKSKFQSDCGWPSFDDEIKGAVDRHVDADGYRVEIVCKNCGGHLGHVFEGEGFTNKNVRHCVNSVSMKFYKKGEPLPEVIKSK